MMKKILTLTILLFCINNLFAQTIRDSVFNNVILINNTDVSTNGFHFLIDIPIKPQKEPIVIFNNDFRISTKLFFSRNSFLYGQNDFFLITPDWEYYNNIEETERKNPSLKLDPYRQNKIYHIQRNNVKIQIDSLSIRMDDPRKPITINFNNPELKENEVKYFFKECYGSTCCPKDENWDFKQENDKIKNDFNEKENVNIYKNVYRQVLGRESEHCDYYTLSDLTNEQKIQFLFPPKTYKETDDVTQGFFVIILPSTIDTTNLFHKNPQKTTKNNNPKKTISGYVYTENDIYVSMSDIKIQVKGAENERHTIPNFDGNFEIEVRKDEVLIIRYSTFSKEIKITNENNYVISLSDKK